MQNQTENLSAAELYVIQLENEEPSFYSRIPHILSHLTYDFIDENGQKSVKKLSIYARELYRVIKQTAGDRGKCWRDTEGLAELCGMSTGSVVNAKKELQQSFNELNGKSLITITKCQRSNFKNDKCVNKSPSHIISVINIWGFNNAYMSTLKYQKNEADSPCERAESAGSPHESALRGADSPHEPNKNHNNKNHLYLKQEPTASPSVFSVDSVSLKKQNPVFLDEKKESAFGWLTKNGCPEQNAVSIIKKFSCQDIEEASKYTEIQLNKNKAKGKSTENKWAYFQNVLNNRYWEKK